jgi:predicted methyltransferase
LPIESFIASEPLDAIWVSDAYGEILGRESGSPNRTWMHASLFGALKPGGELIVEDQRRLAGRIEAEMSKAGFQFASRQNHRDDRVLLKFRKPD